MKPRNFAGGVNRKRIAALAGLTSTLKCGWKNYKEGRDEASAIKIDEVSGARTVNLTEGDVNRINKEISILQSRIVHEDLARSVRSKKHGFRSRNKKGVQYASL